MKYLLLLLLLPGVAGCERPCERPLRVYIDQTKHPDLFATYCGEEADKQRAMFAEWDKTLNSPPPWARKTDD